MAGENPSVTRFREYLRINTMQPNPDYGPAFDFFRKEAKDIGLEFNVYESGAENRSVGIMTWKGTKPELKSVMLTSHMDVVPVFPEHWTYEPFSAHKDEKGNIYARGSQDMKCVSNWYLEAIRRMKSEGKTFARTVHLMFTEDEEIGSAPSENFCKSKTFKDLNVAFGLDEGIANPGEKMRVFYGERSVWWIEVICGGVPGHGSQFIDDTAGPKMRHIINKLYDMRDQQEKKFKENPEAGLGAVTTLNMTMLKGGVQPNVIPADLTATFDIRVPPNQDFAAFETMLNKWAAEAGNDVKINYLQKGDFHELVKLDDSNKFWLAFKEACKTSKIEIQTEIFPAGTDSRFLRRAGVDMLGFSPMNNTPILLHDHNEYLNENVFLRGIDIYCNIISSLASVQE